MADVVDPCCVTGQLSKFDKTNYATANLDDGIISSSEQCDVPQNGTDDKSDKTSDSNTRPLSLNAENNDTIITETTDVSNDEIESSTNTTSLYKDFSGIDTEPFITTTLRNNPKDRTLLLTLEKLFQEFIQNEEQTSYQCQAMNSYERMIVHRVAAFFGLDHNVDKNGQSVVVTKTANTRIPNFSFQNFIPADELSNGATTATTLNSPIENATRRISRRNDKNPNQQTFATAKPSFERANNYVETRDRISSNQSYNKINRKQQQRSYTNHHSQQTNIQPTSHMFNARAQPMYPSASTSFYPQQQQLIDYDYKQQPTGAPMYNYVPMIHPAQPQHGNGIQLPILLHQQPNGQIQYVFSTQSLQQAAPISSDGQYMPVYRSDMVPSVADNNNPYSQSPYVHLYPNHQYAHAPQTTYVQSAPSFMIPPNNNGTSIQYATNQLATLSLQSQYDHVQSRSAQMPIYHQYRQTRPINANNTDKQIENDIKPTINNNSDQTLLTGSAQGKD